MSIESFHIFCYEKVPSEPPQIVTHNVLPITIMHIDFYQIKNDGLKWNGPNYLNVAENFWVEKYHV